MQRITPTAIHTLTKHKDKPAVSIYMSTQSDDFADNRSQLKYLLSEARQELTQFASYKEKHEALYPAYRLLHDRNWWKFVDSGVAIFSTRDGLHAFHLSYKPEDEIVVSNRFHILPLLTHLNQQGKFYVLALSAKNTRLLHCDGEDIYELSVPNMPRSVSDLEVRDDHILKTHKEHKSKPRLKDTLVALRSGGKRAIKRQHQNVLENEYLHQIHKAVHSMLGHQHEPVVLAGLQRVQGLYRKIENGSDYVYPEGIMINPDRQNNLELRDRARLILGEHFASKEINAQSRFLRLSVARPDRVVYGMKNVLKLIYEGKVQTLFIDPTNRQWGKIRRSLVEMHDRRLGGDSDLLDVAASETVKRKGNVFTIESSDLPSNSKVAAILRY